MLARTTSSSDSFFQHRRAAGSSTPCQRLTLPQRVGFAPGSVGSTSPMLADAPFDLESEAPTGAQLGETSKFRSISPWYPSIFVRIEPVSVTSAIEFEPVIPSTK